MSQQCAVCRAILQRERVVLVNGGRRRYCLRGGGRAKGHFLRQGKGHSSSECREERGRGVIW